MNLINLLTLACCSAAALAKSQAVQTFKLEINCYANRTLDRSVAYPFLQTDTPSGDPVFYMLAAFEYENNDKFFFDGGLLKWSVSSDPVHPYSGVIGSYSDPSDLPVFNIIRNNAQTGFGMHYDEFKIPYLTFNNIDNWFACDVPNPQNLPYFTIIHNGDDREAPDGCTRIQLSCQGLNIPTSAPPSTPLPTSPTPTPL